MWSAEGSKIYPFGDILVLFSYDNEMDNYPNDIFYLLTKNISRCIAVHCTTCAMKPWY